MTQPSTSQPASPSTDLRFGDYVVPIDANPPMAKLVRKFKNELLQLEAKKSDPAEFTKRMVGSFGPLCLQLAEALHVNSTVHSSALSDMQGAIEELEDDAGDVTVGEGKILFDGISALIAVVKSAEGRTPEERKIIEDALVQGAKALEIAAELATADEGEGDEEGEEEEDGE